MDIFQVWVNVQQAILAECFCLFFSYQFERTAFRCRGISDYYALIINIKGSQNLKMQLNVGTRTDFTVVCNVNSFDISPGLEPGFLGDQRN